MQAAPWAYTADEWRSVATQNKLDGDTGKIYAVPINVSLESALGQPVNSDRPAVKPKPLKEMSDQELLRLHAQLKSKSRMY